MKLFDVALFVVCIQFAGAMISSSGLFGNSIYYENTLGNLNFSQNMSAISDTEQNQISYFSFNEIKDTLSWGWIDKFFGDSYNNDVGVRNFVDHIKLFLGVISGIIIAAAVIEFFRNQAKVL